MSDEALRKICAETTDPSELQNRLRDYFEQQRVAVVSAPAQPASREPEPQYASVQKVSAIGYRDNQRIVLEEDNWNALGQAVERAKKDGWIFGF